MNKLTIPLDIDTSGFDEGINTVLTNINSLIVKLDELTILMESISDNVEISLQLTGWDKFGNIANILTSMQFFRLDFMTIFEGLKTFIINQGPIIVNAVKALLVGIGTAFKVLRTVINTPVGGIIAIIILIATLIFMHWDKIKAFLSKVGAWIKSKWSSFIGFLSNALGWFKVIKDKILKPFDGIKDNMLTVGKSILDGLFNPMILFNPVAMIMKLISNILNTFKKGFVVHSPSRKMMEIGKFIILGLLEGMKASVQGVMNFVSEFVGNVITWITTNVPMIISAVGTFFATLWTTITTFFANIWTSITMFFMNVWTSITMFFTNLPIKIAEWLAMVITKFGEFATNAITWVNENVVTIIDTIVEFFTGLPEKVKEKATEILTKLSEVNACFKFLVIEV